MDIILQNKSNVDVVLVDTKPIEITLEQKPNVDVSLTTTFQQTQADWAQEDASKGSYIKNKPTDLLRFTPQELTDNQKQIARDNIDAQGLTDLDLHTIQKTVVGAINEILQKINQSAPAQGIYFKGEYREGETYSNYDSVSYLGCIFWCVVESTNRPPLYKNKEWALLVGKPDYVMEVSSTEGNVLLQGDLNTTLIAEVYKYNQRVTPDIPSEQWSWERESAYPDSDVVWNAQHIGIGNELPITAADIPGKGVRKVKFIVKAYMNIEETIIGAVEI